MNKIIDGSHGTAGTRREGGRRLDWRKRMSDTVAYGLLVYTALQIFVTMHAVEGRGGSLLPLVGLVVLVAAIIPLYRRYERRWEVLDNDRAADPSLRSAYRRDQLAVWLLSIGLPFLLTGLYKVIVAFV
ncbi:MAG: hypothetical protein B7Z39_01825 [Novosphingobium sp. 12-64-8]|nr:MAG: hypothetical protein B7Z39_01825 [Novosphingobium sp. 12-64-8]